MSGIPQGFEEVYRAHYKSLRTAANNIIRDADASHDIVQEVFVKLWHRKETLGEIQNMKAYLFRSVVNASITFLSGVRKKKEIDHLHLEAGGTADQHTMEKELQGRIDTALDNLPPKCKAIFVLSRFEGMKNKEIAATLNLSLKTVENQMGIALKKMRDDLKTYLGNSFFGALALAGFALNTAQYLFY